MSEVIGRLVGPVGSLRRHLLLGGGGTLFLKIGNAGLGFALSICLARLLGANGYGVYSFAFAIASMLTVPVQFGLPTLLVREIANYRRKEEWSLLRGILGWASRSVVVALVIILPAAIWLTWAWAGQHENTQAQLSTTLWALALIPFLSLCALQGGALRGLQYVVRGQFPNLVFRQLLLFVALLLSGALWTATPALAMALNVGASAGAVLLSAGLLAHKLPSEVRRARPASESRKWVRSVVPLSLLGGMQVIISQTDIVMLGYLAEAECVGIYRVAVLSVSVVAFGLVAANMVLGPQIARLYYAGEWGGLQQLITNSARFIFVVAVVTTIALTFGLIPLLEPVFGASFVSAGTPIFILSVGQLINAGAGSVALLLNMSGRENIAARAVTFAALFNIVLNMALIPRLGMAGAALATTITTVAWNVMLLVSVRRTMGLDSTPLGLALKTSAT